MRLLLIAALLMVPTACDCGEGSGVDSGMDGSADGRADGGDAIGDVGAPDVGMEAEDAVDLLLEAQCRYAVLCTDSGPLHRSRCHPRTRAERRAATIRAIARGDVMVDAALLDTCRASAAATTCAEADPRCGALVPVRTLGETCGYPEACLEGSCTGVACPLTCTTGLPLAAPCNGPSDCGVGLTCAGDVCVPRSAVGDACSSTLGCLEGTVCDGVCLMTSEVGVGDFLRHRRYVLPMAPLRSRRLHRRRR